jgi:transposase-like protein
VIIQHAVWLYLRFTLSYRDVEELLAERGLDISYETVPAGRTATHTESTLY